MPPSQPSSPSKKEKKKKEPISCFYQLIFFCFIYSLQGSASLQCHVWQGVSAVLFQVRNEPWNVSISAEYIAQVKGISVEEVIEVTTQNALKLFPKLRHLLQK